MNVHTSKGNHSIEQDIITTVSMRYRTITKAINKAFWNTDSETEHSFFVGSYGRGTAINTSDVDLLTMLPHDEYEHFTSLLGNGQSRLLQTVKAAIIVAYPTTNVAADGQVVVVSFSNDMIFEILPAFLSIQNNTFIYPDSNMGGNWMSTNPIEEQKAMKNKNIESNGLLFDTCKHIRYIRDNCFSSYHLSGILIDSFVFKAIGNWHWPQKNEQTTNTQKNAYENYLLSCYNQFSSINSPGSNQSVLLTDWNILGKILVKMVQS